MNHFYRILFKAMAAAGRPIGGIRPRRMVNWIGARAYAGALNATRYEWFRDRWDNELHLNPYYFIDRQIMAFGAYDNDLHEFLERRLTAGMTFFDIGANMGEVSLHMARKVGSAGHVRAFEPVPEVAERLERNVQRNALGGVVRVQRVALSHKTGKTTIACSPPEWMNQGMASIVNKDHEALSRSCEVETITIDDFVAANGVEHIDLMKIDVQGAEPYLLEGGPRVFGSMGPDLVMEVSSSDLKSAGSDGAKLLKMLEDYGYRVHELTAGGQLGKTVSSQVSSDYDASNVFCTKT